MIQPAAASALVTRGAGPSLWKLLGHIPDARRWRQPADMLLTLGRQLEQAAREQGQAASIALGTLRFSLFRMHLAQITQIAPLCHGVTVYGEADIQLPAIPNVQFVPVARGSALSQEWFLIADSPAFWGALIAHPLAERTSGPERRLLFNGVLTADERVVSRASLLLSLTRGGAAPAIIERDGALNHTIWARLAYTLATHPGHDRQQLLSCLTELPAFHSLLSEPNLPLELLLAHTLELLSTYHGSTGGIIYRCDGPMLIPAAWSGNPPPAQPAHQGVAGEALSQRSLVLMPLTPSDPEQALLPEAQSVAAVPLISAGAPWGVLLVGQADPDPGSSATAAGVAGVASLLAQLMTDAPPPGRPGAAVASLSAPAPTSAAPFAAPPAWPPPTSAAAPPAWAHATPAPATPAPPAPGAAPTAPAAPPAAWASHRWASYAPAGDGPAVPAASPAEATPGFHLPSWMRPAGGQRPPGQSQAAAPTTLPAGAQGQPDWPVLLQRLLAALVAYNQLAAEEVWSEVVAHYPPEAICVELLAPLQTAVGEGWHRGEISVTSEHFSSRFVQTKLLNLFNASAESAGGPMTIVCCAQGEMHEIGAIMLSLFLRWSGFRVVYLGQNVPNSTIEDMVEQLRPQALVLSASTVQAAHNLIEVGQLIERMEPPRPHFVYGGRAFQDRPELQARIRGGTFLHGDLRAIVGRIAELTRTA